MTKDAKAHSKFSASGAERWINCSGSVALSEGLPDKTSPSAEEGTLAHKVLEIYLTHKVLEIYLTHNVLGLNKIKVPKEMERYAKEAAHFIFGLRNETMQVLSEERVYLDFIHPEAFGTLDAAVVDYFGILHIFDFKYGKGHPVSPTRNLQLIFYALGAASLYDWNFKRVRMWIIQPRIRGYDGPVFWEITIQELKEYIQVFRDGINRVEQNSDVYTEGPWCYFCKAKNICPLKRADRNLKAISHFER